MGLRQLRLLISCGRFEICSNPYDATVEAQVPNAIGDHVPHAVVYNIIRPSFHKECEDDDMMGILKRVFVVLLAEDWIYMRPPSQNPVSVARFPYGASERLDVNVL